MLQAGTFVYVTGKVVERYNQADMWELRPRKLRLLSEVRDQMSKALQLHLPLTAVNEALITQLAQAITQHPGNCPLTVTVAAPEEAMSVTLMANSYGIQLSNELLAVLRPLEGLTYRLQV